MKVYIKNKLDKNWLCEGLNEYLKAIDKGNKSISVSIERIECDHCNKSLLVEVQENMLFINAFIIDSGGVRSGHV